MRTHKEHLVNKGKKQKNSFACSSQQCYFENFEFACYSGVNVGGFQGLGQCTIQMDVLFVKEL